MKSIFNPPTSCEVEYPQSSDISNLILEQPSSYWESGGGDAAIRYIDDNGQTVSEIVFLLRESVGVYIQFLPAKGSNSIVCNNPKNLQLENEVTVTHCGSPLTLPLSYFVDRQTAAQVIGTFIDNRDGELPAGFNWVEG